MLAVSHVDYRRVAAPWDRARVEGSRPTRVGREAYVRPDPAVVAAYCRIFPSRFVVWDYWRQMFAIYDRNSPGWREFVMELKPAPMPESDEEQEELERQISHLPRIVDQGQLYVGCFTPFTHAWVNRRARERAEFLAAGAKRYAEKLADRNRTIGKRVARAAAVRMAHRIAEIRRWLPVISGTGDKIPLVPGGLTK